jgi:hypothetical protein
MSAFFPLRPLNSKRVEIKMFGDMTPCQWIIRITEDFDLYEQNSGNLKPQKLRSGLRLVKTWKEVTEKQTLATTLPGDKEFSSARDFTSKLGLSGCDAVQFYQYIPVLRC